MAFTLIVNPGSTSRKYALYHDSFCVCVLFFEEVGDAFKLSIVRNGVKKGEENISILDFTASLAKAVSFAVAQKYITKPEDITAVGVRIVAPGTYFTTHKTIDEKYIQKLQEVQDVAPLHIPEILEEIAACKKVIPAAKCIGVSDSAFHSTIPKHISTVSISQIDAEAFDIRRFGYHGLSFASVSRRLTDTFPVYPKRTIVCHIGGGVSVTALKNGRSVATSMGYSPASGVLMGSRGGDVDADVLAALSVRKNLDSKKLYEYLYENSGFQGVAGVHDLRLLLDHAQSGDFNAQLALDMFVYQVQSLIGAYAVLLGGVDAIVMTATASLRNPRVRSLILSNLSALGVVLDTEKNEDLIGREGFIHAADSAVEIAVLKTDEMTEIYHVVKTKV